MSESRLRRFRIEHVSEFEYAEPARGSVMLLRLHPRQDRRQRLIEFGIDIDPPAAAVAAADCFGNVCHQFNIHRDHLRTRVRSLSVVETVGPPTPPERLGADAWDLLRRPAPARHWTHLAPSRFARPSPALAAFAAERGLAPGPDPLSTLRDACAALHAAFAYAPGATDADSPIEQVLETRRGVCQDYAHVMIALARGWGIPSRYVSGYLHLEGVEGEQTPEGASHAWAEFRLPGLGWVGFDPTNGAPADHRHVRVAVGRDYADAAPTRGVLFGGGGESRLSVSVTVSEDGADAPVPAPRREHRILTALMSTPRAGPPQGQQQQ